MAIFSFRADAAGSAASYTPFCAFSPEWQALEAGRAVGAETLFCDLPAWDPAFGRRANRYADPHGARAEAADPFAVARADAAPSDVDAQLAAADAEIAGQQVEAAFDRLVGTVRRTAGDERDRVRKHLVELFELFPPDDPAVAAARAGDGAAIRSPPSTKRASKPPTARNTSRRSSALLVAG